MLKIWLIRHGKTAGNLLKRYIGSTDEDLCEAGVEELRQFEYPVVDCVYVSPLKRCRQTAEILYPNLPFILEENLRECDFGLFENKNYKELDGNPEYQAWIDSNGTLPFPGGESVEAFKERVQNVFSRIVTEAIESRKESIALVIHGGTIMSILERWGTPTGEYYRWQAENGKGYVLLAEEELWREKKELSMEHPPSPPLSAVHT